jgi:ABC-type transport system involved in cytochrome c biogenesis permease subunit
MRKLFTLLASLKLAVILLLLLLVGLSTGTIIETRLGTEVAGRAVYYSWWFLGLQGLFAVNLALSIADLFPWTKKRIGFVVTHASLLLIMAGAATSYFLKIEGTMGLWEGDRASVIQDKDGQGNIRSEHQLPFDVALDKFELQTYPGTMRPSGFLSHVEITDHDTGRTFPADIWMNHELHHRGFALFQSSYQQDGGRQATVLAISKDPGQNLVFAGYLTLLAGMIIVLSTRIAQARESAARAVPAKAAARRGPGRKALLVLLLLSVAGLARAGTVADTLRPLPVQHDGRVMPLDTLARESVWEVTGASAWHGEDPVATFTGWLFDPQTGANSAPIKVGSKAFVRELGLPEGTTHATFLKLTQTPRLLELVTAARQAEAEGRPRAGLLQQAENLDKRLGIMQSILQQQIVRPIPIPGSARAAWGLPMAVSAAGFTQLLAGPRPEGWASAAQMDTEVLYNQLGSARLSWIILLAALGLSLAAWRRNSKLLDGIAFGVLVAGFAMMSWGIQLRWTSGQRFPAANMYESMLFLAWGVGLFAIVAYGVLRNRVVVVNAAGMAALAMILIDLLPIDHFIHPVAPVLAGTPWLAIHVPIIMVSYSILALGLVVAHMQIGFTIFAPGREELIEKMYDLLYWYIFVGCLFLIAGIITGSMWAASSWGRYWGWDPKEVWSLVAFLAYMAILHAKLDRIIGKFGVAAISIAAFQTILMTYLGVNFVLTTGKHSYGMGDTPVLMWMLLVAAAEAIFIAWGAVAYSRRQQPLKG